MERTLVLVKPDGVQRGLAGEIISRIERRGLKIVGMKMLHIDLALARKHYGVHEGKPFFEGLISYISSSPVIAAVFEGPRAVDTVRNTMGATDPVKAGPGTIRGDLGLEMGRNLVHGSDSPENAATEIATFFAEAELWPYERNIDPWIIET